MRMGDSSDLAILHNTIAHVQDPHAKQALEMVHRLLYTTIRKIGELEYEVSSLRNRASRFGIR